MFPNVGAKACNRSGGRFGQVGVAERGDPRGGGLHRLIEAAEHFGFVREESGIVDGGFALAETRVVLKGEPRCSDRMR